MKFHTFAFSLFVIFGLQGCDGGSSGDVAVIVPVGTNGLDLSDSVDAGNVEVDRDVLMDTDGDNISDDVDNCPSASNTNQLDTDSNGAGDACDLDDDGDGFSDSDDPAPLDGTIPGDFSTPDAILNDQSIQTAIAEAAALGFVVATQTGENPPNLTGYYNRTDLGGNFPFNSSGSGQNTPIVGAEFRINQLVNNTYNRASVSFTSLRPISFGIGEGSLIRGEDNEFTLYSRSKSTCTEAESDFSTFGVTIASGSINPENGDIENRRSISTTVNVAGQLTTACADRLNGDGEQVGAWSALEVPVSTKVEPAELIYMCVDGDAAYAPTETWVGSDGLSCSCTTDYQISCE